MDLPTPGTTKPLLTEEPIGTEGEMTPGADDETPFDAEENRRDWKRFRETRAGQAVPDGDTPAGTAPELGGSALEQPPVLDAPEFAHGDRDDREDGLPDEQDGEDLLGSITGDTGPSPGSGQSRWP